MEVKVCGLTLSDQMDSLNDADYLGLIFVSDSPRNAFNSDADSIRLISTQKVGVFVNSTIQEILDKITLFGLSVIQLHGNESPQFCRELTNRGIRVWKAFPVNESDDLGIVSVYEGCVERAVLDTQCLSKGGSGLKFDWAILDKYSSSLPFMLAGGISPDDVVSIKAITHPGLAGVDINSRFELSPGIKDIESIHKFINSVKL